METCIFIYTYLLIPNVEILLSSFETESLGTSPVQQNSYLHYSEQNTQVPRKKTVLRTIRINQELDNILQKEAKDRRMSLNAFISTILSKHAEWDRYAERFGYISLTHESFMSIIDLVDDDKLRDIAQNYGSRVPKEFMLFWFKQVNIEAFLTALSLRCKYAGIAEYDIDSNGRNYTITLYHKIGQKWSIFLSNVICKEIESILGVVPNCHITTNSIFIRFFVQ